MALAFLRAVSPFVATSSCTDNRVCADADRNVGTARREACAKADAPFDGRAYSQSSDADRPRVIDHLGFGERQRWTGTRSPSCASSPLMAASSG